MTTRAAGVDRDPGVIGDLFGVDRAMGLVDDEVFAAEPPAHPHPPAEPFRRS
jgi:hypothetical protein